MRKIYIVDAFTTVLYKGNPAAVMLVNDFPDDMAAIANEMNLSETAFVKQLGTDHFHIRWMTPITEVKLCGHATLAASHVIFNNGINSTDKITFESLSGPLIVEKTSHGYTLNFPLQKTGSSLSKTLFSQVIPLEQIVDVVQAYDDIIVHLKSDQNVINFVPNIQELVKFEARGVIITAQSGHNHDFVSRFFAPKVGVNEDPVTGSAHCKLAHYWSEKLQKAKLTAYQASKRGGELLLEIQYDIVLITGNAITFLEGTLS